MTAIPFVTDFDPTYGQSVEVSPRLRRVVAENPGPFTYTGSGTYLIGRGEVAIIDPGPEDAAHTRALLAATEGERITHILVTHAHRDHCGGVAALKEATGAAVYAFGPHTKREEGGEAPALDEGVDYGFTPDVRLAHGDKVESPDWTLEAVHTPGHVSNHLCYAFLEENALFTGDHMMGWATTVIIPPDGDMGDYFKSLQLLLDRGDAVYYPTHGAPIDNTRQFTRAVLTHRRMRDGQILDQIAKGRTAVKDMVAAMYAEVDPRLHPAAALSVTAHLIELERTGRVVQNADKSYALTG